jgi:hypothetical protein
MEPRVGGQPEAGGDERPWEAAGGVRCDCEPDRAQFLVLLSTLSAVFSLFSLCLLPCLVAVPLGLAVCVMTKRDFKKMDAGLMDRRGWDRTWEAESRGLYGLALGIGGLVFRGLVMCAVVLGR